LTNCHLDADGGFVQRLICEETVTESRGNNRSSTTTKALWEDERVLTGELLGDDRSRSAVPVLFGIPFEFPETGQDGRQVRWKLEMEAAVPGVDYRANFIVPAFKTPQSLEGFVLDESPIEHLCLPVTLGDRLRRAGAKVREDGGDIEAAFPLLLNKSAFFNVGIFTAIWFGFTVLIHKLGAPILFPIVFGLFGLLMLLVLFSMVFTNKRLKLSKAELIAGGGLFGREKRFPYSEISKVETHCGMRAGTHAYFSVRVEDKQGQKADLIPDVRPASTARALLEEIKARMASDNYG